MHLVTHLPEYQVEKKNIIQTHVCLPIFILKRFYQVKQRELLLLFLCVQIVF